MSNNCVRCVENQRDPNNPGSLYCKECEHLEWTDTCNRTVKQYPPLAEFLNMYAPFCGTSRATFTGQTVRMLHDVLKMAAKQLDDALETTTAGALFQAISPKMEEDLLLALRFAYYVRASSLVPDALYDEAEKEFVNRPETPDETPLMQPGSDKEEDYPSRVRALALYLALARADRNALKPRSAALPASPSRPESTGKAKTPKKAVAPESGNLF